MPELAEVEFFRRRWAEAATGQRVRAVLLHPAAKVFRGSNPAALQRTVTGARLASSETRAKQMLFRFGRDAWVGIHLGMSGELRVEAPGYTPGRHDHLVL